MMFEVKNLSCFYEQCVVDQVSFQIDEDEVVGLLGKNGSGKTSLLKGIMGSIHSHGQVKVQGLDILSMPIKKRAKYISILTQRFDVMEGISAIELIEMGRYAYSRMFEIPLQDQDIDKIANILNIQNLLEKDYTTLSEGQKQLVQLAKLIVQDTPVMLLDEPDSALDYDNRHMIYSFITQHIKSHHKSSFIVLHDPLYALTYCDRILLMDKGKIIDEIHPFQEDCQTISKKIQKLYPHLDIKQDGESQQYYTILKENIKNER